LALRSALHRRGLRFVVDRPVPGGDRRRRVDILLRGARVAVFVDGCFWHSCPEHSHLPRTNTSWWRRKFRGIARRDRDTDARLAAAGWLVVRVWEHEDPDDAAESIDRIVRHRAGAHGPRRPHPDRRVRSGDGGGRGAAAGDGRVGAGERGRRHFPTGRRRPPPPPVRRRRRDS